MAKLMYKDEDGNVLYGFSLKNLELIYGQLKAVKKVGIAAVILGFLFFLMALYALWQIKKYAIVNEFLERCVC